MADHPRPEENTQVRSYSPSEKSIRNAVRAILSDSSYRARARQLQDEIAGYDAPKQAADVIESVLRSAPPVPPGDDQKLAR